MTPQKTHRIIAVGAMAAVIGIGIVTFAIRSQPVASVAESSDPPPPVATMSTASDAEAPNPAPPVAATQAAETPAAVADSGSVGTKGVGATASSGVQPKLSQERHAAKADATAVAAKGTVSRDGSVAATSAERAPDTVDMRVERLTSADQLTPPPAVSNPPADDLRVATASDLAASDSQITTDVKSAIAGDSLSKDLNIGVTTTRGVVSLTGSLASQDAIDQVKNVAGKVKDVRSVDTSALILASL
jgi:hyperosmotically inducible periplasmic protein